jgi:pimeloyl-ACP methyl ester carboxylesterase
MRLALVTLAATFAAVAPAAAQTPGVPPPGANDFTCRSAAHPVPVILVHGTFGDMTVSWNELSPLLKAQGYCVFALDLVRRGTAPIDESADKLAAFSREVLTRTGAAKVSFVGHSQGGMLGRYVAKSRGLLEQTDDVVGLAPSSHGTTSPGADPAAQYFNCPACAEQKAGSPFMAKVNTAPEAPEPASYTVISTRYDQVVQPVESQALTGATVTNVVLQDKCPADFSEHLGIIYDPIALQWVLDALGRAGPASPGFEPTCSLGTTSGGDSAPSDRAERRVEVSRASVRLRPGDVLPIRVKCVGDRDCSGVLELRSRGMVIARRAFLVPADTKRAVRLRLRRAGAAELRGAGRLRLSALATVARDGGVAERVNTRFTAVA